MSKLLRPSFRVVAFSLATSLFAFSPAGLAQTASPAAAIGQAQDKPAGKFIQDLGNQAITIMADKSLPQPERTKKYRDMLQSSFDMPVIGHFVLGRAWDAATPAQQQEFMELFQQIVLKTYGDRLNFYSGEGFQVKGERPESEKDTVVNSEITHNDKSPPTKIDWRVRQADGKPQIIDVVVEGVSQSTTQRQEYTSIIQRNNGNIDGLLKLMRQRVQQPDTSSN